MRLDLMETFLCIFLMEHFPLHLEPIIEISLHYIFSFIPVFLKILRFKETLINIWSCKEDNASILTVPRTTHLSGMEFSLESGDYNHGVIFPLLHLHWSLAQVSHRSCWRHARWANLQCFVYLFVIIVQQPCIAPSCVPPYPLLWVVNQFTRSQKMSGLTALCIFTNDCATLSYEIRFPNCWDDKLKHLIGKSPNHCSLPASSALLFWGIPEWPPFRQTHKATVSFRCKTCSCLLQLHSWLQKARTSSMAMDLRK